MEHARLNLMTTDPTRLGDAVQYLEHDARARVEKRPGSLGMSLAVDEERGVAVMASFWVSGDAMRESEKQVAALADEVVRKGAGTLSVERYELASVTRLHRGAPGAGVRITRAERRRDRVDEAVAAYEDTALPWLTESDGFCSAVLFVNRQTGRAVEETVWRDQAALAASRGTAAAVRSETVAATDAEIVALEEYRLVFNTTPFE
jgi:quinol monooxygenase YgiN